MRILLQLVTQIPDFLELRSTWGNVLAGTLFIIAFIVLAVANLLRPGFYVTTSQFIFKLNGIQAFTKEFLPIGRQTSLLLFVNYIISILGINALIIKSEGLNSQIYLEVLVLISVNVYHLLSLSLMSILTGARSKFIEAIYFKLTGLQWLGVAYFVIGVLWFFSNEMDLYFLWVLLTLTLAEWFIRIFKSFLTSLRSGATWYYIILYLCTLEILPVAIFMLLVSKV